MSHPQRTRAHSARVRWRALPSNTRGAVWALSGAAFSVGMLVFVKMLEGRINPFQISFLRVAISLLFIPMIMGLPKLSDFKTGAPVSTLARSVLATLGISLAFYAVGHMPLADAQAISFASVLFMAPMAVLINGERVGPRRAVAAVVGFVGVLIILRPTGEFNLAAGAALASAICFGAVVALVRRMSRKTSVRGVYFYGVGLMGLFSAPLAVMDWTPLTAREWAILTGVAILGIGTQFSNVQAFSAAETSAIAPVGYMRLVFAIAIGMMFFAETPDAWMLAGSAVIVASTLYITWREAQLHHSQASSMRSNAADIPSKEIS